MDKNRQAGLPKKPKENNDCPWAKTFNLKKLKKLLEKISKSTEKKESTSSVGG